MKINNASLMSNAQIAANPSTQLPTGFTGDLATNFTQIKTFVLNGAWSLSSGGTTTGVNIITSTIANNIIHTATATATGNNQKAFQWTGNVTTENVNDDNLDFITIDPTMTRNVGNPTGQTTTVLRINGTFANSPANSNLLKLQTAGVDKLTINSNGAISIGASSPSSNSLITLVGGGLNIGGIATTDASIHVQTVYGGSGRLTQMSTSGISVNAVNLISSTNAASAALFFAWGVLANSGTFAIRPGANILTNPGFTINTSGIISLEAYTTNNGILYTNGSGVVSQATLATLGAWTATGTTTITGNTTQDGLFTNTFNFNSISILQHGQSGAALSALIVQGGSHLATTASAELIDINFALNRTSQFATGSITTQRTFLIQAPTYGFVGASTITNAYTFYVDREPQAGTNATITNGYAAGFGGNVALITAGNKFFIKEGTNGSMGQTTLVSGTKAITISGVTTATRAFVQLVTPSGVTLTVNYQAVCTANTLTIQANIAAGTINTADGSTLNYILFQPTP